ncbi:MAG TPA: hypothetical protein VM489_07580 [Burkholderiales bacterium]|nr:hypothetical protein [Burkholderiales bacterium]
MGHGRPRREGHAELGAPYGAWEREYLAAFPELGAVLARMVELTTAQLAEPQQDILHNRLCAALVWRMGREAGLEAPRLRLALIADLLHNVAKEDPRALLSAREVLERSATMVGRLRAAGYFRSSPVFWSRPSLFDNPRIGANRALVHHVTGALEAERLMDELGGFSRAEIDEVQAAILAHSTGYHYLREAVDAEARAPGAWRALFPEPEAAPEVLAHDADLVSQFVPETVLPAQSKWRRLARERWGATSAKQEARIIGEILARLKDEARSALGRRLAQEHWAALEAQLKAIS